MSERELREMPIMPEPAYPPDAFRTLELLDYHAKRADALSDRLREAVALIIDSRPWASESDAMDVWYRRRDALLASLPPEVKR